MATKEYFKGISKIQFEGKESDNPMAFKYYNPDQVIAGKTMREHLDLQLLIGIHSADKEEILSDQEHKILLGINQQIQFKLPKTKQMQHLNLLTKWALIISVFTITI